MFCVFYFSYYNLYMKVYEINPQNFGKYKHKLSGILKKPNMCGVFSDSCGHCDSMKPEWNKLKEKVAGTPGEGNLIEIDSRVLPEIDYKPLSEKVQGYPTILIIKNGIPKMEYNGNRTFDDMYKYFTKNTCNSPNKLHRHMQRYSPLNKLHRHMQRYNPIHTIHNNSMPTVINNDEPRRRNTQKRKRKYKRKRKQKGGSKKKVSKYISCNKNTRKSKKCICSKKCKSYCPSCNKIKKHTR